MDKELLGEIKGGHPSVLGELKMLTYQQVLDSIGVSRMTLYRMLARGGFPAPLKLSVNSYRFRYLEVLAWVEGKWAPHNQSVN